MHGNLFETRFGAGILSGLCRFGNIGYYGPARRIAPSTRALLILALLVSLVTSGTGVGIETREHPAGIRHEIQFIPDQQWR